MRLFFDPTLQFLFILLLAPLCAMLSASLESSQNTFSTELAGWLVTLSLWSFFAIRSVRHQWKSMKRSQSNGWHYLLQRPIELRLLVGVSVCAVIATLAGVVVAALLIADITARARW